MLLSCDFQVAMARVGMVATVATLRPGPLLALRAPAPVPMARLPLWLLAAPALLAMALRLPVLADMERAALARTVLLRALLVTELR